MISFLISIFVSAFLLFQVQPIIGKLLLPWFGGTPTVWSTVLLFFQLPLIAGYAYAYWLIAHVSLKKQALIHLWVLASALFLVLILALVWPSAITPDPSWKAHTTNFPIWHIFILLTISVGLPYFILATNAPLMQAWFNVHYPKQSPYKLYSLSNTGSLLGLISYPFVIEPWLSIHWQGKIWSLLFVAWVVLVATITIRLHRLYQKIHIVSDIESSPKPSTHIQLLWICLSACASMMLMAVTNQITQEITAIPFLWVLPLTLYLLSFILTFNNEQWYNRLVFSFLLLVSSLCFMGTISSIVPANLITSICTYGFLLFACCMVCNGEAYRLRPPAAHLTRFYLMLAIGGAIGGMIVNFVAPAIFTGYWELELGLTLCWVLLSILAFTRSAFLEKKSAALYQSLILTATIFICAFSLQFIFATHNYFNVAVRNFYGIVRVKEEFKDDPNKHIYYLTNGATLHGLEFAAPAKRDKRVAYYSPNSGIGLTITHHPLYKKGLHIGILGLGAGMLASYGQPGDYYRFYDINPAVIALAQGKGGYFHYLQDTRAHVDVILGDARISLEKELAAGQKHHFDILAMDTFSSDAIPLHLLTKEAIAIYLAHLKNNGILAMHISNRNLDLQPVMWQLAKFYKLNAIRIDTAHQDFHLRSSWVLLSRNKALLSRLANLSHAKWLTQDNNKPLRLWTDDYSNLLQILK